MATPPKTPPRFVPTLTEVVQTPDESPFQGSSGQPAGATTVQPPASAQAAPAASSRIDPPAQRPAPPFSPIARPPAVIAQRPAAASMPAQPTDARPANGPGSTAMARPLPEGMEEYMVHRVMQRVDVVLEQRLRDAIATVVQEQTRSVLPRLREEIESVVRHSVYEAVADELAGGKARPPKG